MPVHKASMELLVRLEERDVPCPLCVQGLLTLGSSKR